jgi:hypothetical protein
MQMVLLFIFYVFSVKAISSDSNCLAPSQNHLERILDESFKIEKGKRELREWMLHPSNGQLREDIKEIDRAKKYAFRPKEEALLDESQKKFEQVIVNNERPALIENFPEKGASSEVTASKGALTIEMSSLSKYDLSVIPKEVLNNLDPKIKINYVYPYDKYEYFLTYKNRELPMRKALNELQEDYEDACLMKDAIQDRTRIKNQQINKLGAGQAN